MQILILSLYLQKFLHLLSTTDSRGSRVMWESENAVTDMWYAGLFHNEKNFTISFIRYKEQSPEFYPTYWHSLIKKCSAPIKILSIFCSLCHTAFVNNIFCCIAFEICNGIWFFLWLKHLWKILCEVWRKNVVSREK